MSKRSCRDFLLPVLKQHTDLAGELLEMVKSRNTSDPTHRFQIVGITVFLGGVDKVLNLACKLLCIAGLIDRTWLASNPKDYRGAALVCTRGLTAKINKLVELGALDTDLSGLVEIRNRYLHSQDVTAGYNIGYEGGNLTLKAHGPIITFSGEPLAAVDSNALQHWSEKLVEQIATFLDNKTKFWLRWDMLRKHLEELPRNPEPEFTTIKQCADVEHIADVLEQLNAKTIGKQWQHLLEKTS